MLASSTAPIQPRRGTTVESTCAILFFRCGPPASPMARQSSASSRLRQPGRGCAAASKPQPVLRRGVWTVHFSGLLPRKRADATVAASVRLRAEQPGEIQRSERSSGLELSVPRNPCLDTELCGWSRGRHRHLVVRRPRLSGRKVEGGGVELRCGFGLGQVAARRHSVVHSGSGQSRSDRKSLAVGRPDNLHLYIWRSGLWDQMESRRLRPDLSSRRVSRRNESTVIDIRVYRNGAQFPADHWL